MKFDCHCARHDTQRPMKSTQHLRFVKKQVFHRIQSHQVSRDLYGDLLSKSVENSRRSIKCKSWCFPLLKVIGYFQQRNSVRDEEESETLGGRKGQGIARSSEGQEEIPDS